MALFICHWGAHFLSTICYIFILSKTEMKDLPNFLPRLCEKYGGADRSQIHPYVWNLEMSDVNALLIEGKTFDKQQRTKKTKSRKKGGNPR